MVKENNVTFDNEQMNEINIFDEVLQTIAAHTVKETEGVSLSTSFADGIMEKIVKKTSARAVKVDIQDKTVVLDVHIQVQYGVKIQDICATLQANIKRDIESVTDLIIEKINVFVDNITLESDEKKVSKNVEEKEQEN